MNNQILSILLCALFAFWSCEDESDNSVTEPEPIITFEKDIDNVKSAEAEGYFFVHPFDGPKTLQGSATIGLELTNYFNEINKKIDVFNYYTYFFLKYHNI